MEIKTPCVVYTYPKLEATMVKDAEGAVLCVIASYFTRSQAQELAQRFVDCLNGYDMKQELTQEQSETLAKAQVAVKKNPRNKNASSYIDSFAKERI